MALGIITGIILVVLTVGAAAFAGMFFDDERSGLGTLFGITAFVLLIACILVPFSFRTVDTGEVAVVKRLGKVVDVRTAGTSFDLWVLKSYTKYDAKVQNLEVTTMAYSSDAQTMDIQMTVQYQIMTDKVIDITTQYGSLEVLENRISSIAIEKTKAVLSSHKAMDIIADRASISPAVEKTIKEAIGEEYFVDVTAVVLTNIDFSDAFELAVEEKMIAEQAKLKADYENEKKVAQAEAEAEAKLKAAQAEIEIAKAEAEAKKIAAEAEAEANRIIAESLSEDILNKILADAWNGELPVVVGNGEYILPTDILE